MNRLLLGVILLTGCAEPSAPGPLLSTAASTLRLDHGAFANVTGYSPLGHTPTYMHVGSTTVPIGDGVASVTLPVGTTLTAITASLYLDTAGLTGGSGRIIDVALWRTGYGRCAYYDDPRLGEQVYAQYCPVAFVYGQTGLHSVGWQVRSAPVYSHAPTIEAGFTYSVYVNLRGDLAPHHRLRVEYVEIQYGPGTPAPNLAAVALTP